MAQFKVTAPGKVILYGEHAVVYGKTAVAASLGLRTTLDFIELPEREELIKISCPKVFLNVDVPVGLIRNICTANETMNFIENHDALHSGVKKFVSALGYANLQQRLSLEAFFYLLVYVTQKEGCILKPFQIIVNTELTVGAGLGSSASFAVCLAATFLHWSRIQKNERKTLDKQDLDIISKYALNCERIVHGTPSGIDNSVCTYGSIIEFKKGESIKSIACVPSMRILLVDTRVSRNTRSLVERFAELKHKYPVIIDLILQSIDNITKEAIEVIKRIRDLPSNDTSSANEEYKQLMTLITMNHGLLATCQVSHPSLDRICAEAQNYALAGKLTGAGGGGYAYILLLPETNPETISCITRKLLADGFSVTLTTLGGAGVQIHE